MVKSGIQRIKEIYAAAPKVLIVILAIDVIIIALAVTRSLIHWFDLPYDGFFVNDMLTITEDGKLGEIFQYVKEIGIVVIAFLIFKNTEWRSFIAWGILFLYILVDDILGIHESIGEQFAQLPDMLPSIGISNADLGELAAYALFGVIFLVVIVFGYMKTPQESRLDFKILLVFFFLLMFFGVFVDIFVSPMFDSYVVSKGVHIFEEAGEMIAMSLIFWFVIGLYAIRGREPQLVPAQE